MSSRTLDFNQVRPSDSGVSQAADVPSGRWRLGIRLLTKTLGWGFKITAALMVFSVVLTLLYGYLPIPLTPLMVIRATEEISSGEWPRFEKDWVKLENISPRLVQAAIAAEDMRFYEHNGFDWEAIEKARLHNSKGRKIRGASTISQQTAKNVFLWPARSWVRKGIEVWFTALIELFWPKRRIMEVYLNVVEFGDGVYGAEAAARKYFRKPASKLSASEAALMVAVLPNPNRLKIARPSSYVRFRQTLIQRRMWMAKPILSARKT